MPPLAGWLRNRLVQSHPLDADSERGVDVERLLAGLRMRADKRVADDPPSLLGRLCLHGLRQRRAAAFGVLGSGRVLRHEPVEQILHRVR